MRLKDNMTYEEKVEFFFENDDRKGELSDDCFCFATLAGKKRTAYTITVDSRPAVTEISVYTYEHADKNEETEAKLADVLDEYGVYDWTDLPVAFKGCCFCPFRYECDTVREEVEDYWRTFIE